MLMQDCARSHTLEKATLATCIERFIEEMSVILNNDTCTPSTQE